MKIICFESEGWQQSYFYSLNNMHTVIYDPLPLNVETATKYKSADIITTFIKSKPDAKTLSKFLQLKLVATRSTGFDHIDLKYCKDSNIAVCNVPTYGENTIAEYVFAILLSLSREIPKTLSQIDRNNFSRENLQGFDLRNKTIGIIGVGNIGKYTAKIAKGFDMKVLAHDLCPDESYAKKAGFTYVSLGALLKESDIVTLHVPANEKTKNMISRQELSMMKPSSILINTARGSAVNYNDLQKALENKKIFAAGLDVFPDEASFFAQTRCSSLEINNKLLSMENVIVTPHNAYNTVEAVNRILEITIDNIRNFTEAKPTNIVVG